jgi:hypothetical protein
MTHGTTINELKFKVGDLVLYQGGLFRVAAVWSYYNLGKEWFAQIGDIITSTDELQKADWRDITRITKGGAQ